MVSLQPISQSIIDVDESATLLSPVQKEYNRGSLMYTLMQKSPLFAYLAQLADLDDYIDSEYFGGTCFAPCKEYCLKSFGAFQEKIDRLTARTIVLAHILPYPASHELLRSSEVIPTQNARFSLYITTKKDKTFIDKQRTIFLYRPDLICQNGILHLTNGFMADMDI